MTRHLVLAMDSHTSSGQFRATIHSSECCNVCAVHYWMDNIVLKIENNVPLIMPPGVSIQLIEP